MGYIIPAMELAQRLIGIPRAWWNISDDIGRSAGNIAENITHNELVKATVHYFITMGIFIGVPTASVLVLNNIYQSLTGTQAPDISLGTASGGGGEVIPTPIPTDQVIFQATPTPQSDMLTPVKKTVDMLQTQGWSCELIDSAKGIGSAFKAALKAGVSGVLEPGPYQHVVNDGRAILKQVLPSLVWKGNAICVNP